jgi:hypothetical protein
VIPVAQFTATQWSLLGVDGLEPKSLPEEFEPGKPQLPAEDVLHLWREWNTGILRFDNLTGFPAYISCDGVEGVILQRYDERKNFGRVNRVTIEDAREVAPNAIFVYLDWLDTAGDDRDGPRVLVPDLSVEPYSGLIDFHAPEDCSLDMADAYVASQNVVQ